MLKKFNIFALTLLIIGQTILGPMAVSAETIPVAPASQSAEEPNADTTGQTGSTTEPEVEVKEEPEIVVPETPADTLDSEEGKENIETPVSDPEGGIGGGSGEVLNPKQPENLDDPDGDEESEADVALAEAEKAVEKAEASRILGDREMAQLLVGALEESAEKNALLERLNVLMISSLAGAEISDDINLIKDVVIWTKPDDKGQPTSESKKITEVRPSSGETLSVDYAWELPGGHKYKEGDTFSFQLPDKFKPGRELIGQINGAGGEYIGDFFITPEGKITFTFNEEINDGQGFEGNFYVWRQFEANKLEGGTKEDIIFDYNGSASVTIPVHFEGPASKITKKGIAVKDGITNNRNSDNIEWTVDFNKGEQPITNAVFEDKLPAGLTIDMASIKVRELTVKLDGSVSVNPSGVVPAYTPTDTGSGFTLAFDGEIDKAYRVTYTTKVAAPSGTNPDDYKPTYENNVVIKGAVDSNPFEEKQKDSVTITFNEPLNKELASSNSAEQEITWKIEYNFNQQPIKAPNNVLRDRFDTTLQELVTNPGTGEIFEVFKVQIGSDGKAKDREPVTRGSGYTYANVAGGFDLTIDAGSTTAYEIIYKTKATGRILEDTLVSNKVETDDNATSGDIEHTFKQEVFKKNNGNINYHDKKITWTIDLNKDHNEMTDVVITDKFAGQGLTLNPDTFSISGLVKDTDYMLEPDLSYNEGFKLTFIGTKTIINEYYKITYETDFDPKHFTPDEVKTRIYKNEAELDWKEKDPDNPPSFAKKGAFATPDSYMKKNGNKTGTYDATTKTFTWTVDVNFNRHTISKAVVRDFYTSEQNFVTDSLQVLPLTIGTGNTVTPEAAISEGAYTVDYTVKDGDKDGFELTFNRPIDSAYRITYQTDLKGLPVLKEGYSNQATLHDESNSDQVLFNEKATPVIQHKGEYVDKELPKQGTGADEVYATWTVNINRSQSYVEDASLTDTLSANQILQQDSFQLYKPTVAVDGGIGNVNSATLIDSSKYDITFETNDDGKESFTLTFKDSIEEAYILQYKSYLNAEKGDPISNTVKFAGQVTGLDGASDNQTQVADFSGGAGGTVFATGTGSIQIIKKDADDPNKVLEGAVFDLYDESGTNFLERLRTDEDGKATTTKKHKYRNYMLKEVKAPDGYAVSKDYQTEKVVKFDKDTTFEIENTKIPGDVVIRKQDADTDALLPGAVFEIYHDKGNGVEDANKVKNLIVNDNDVGATVITGGNGTVRVTLPPGNYIVVEKTPPDGYYELAEEDNLFLFTIEFNQAVVQPELAKVDVTNKIIPDSIVVHKIDNRTKDPILGEATFELYYANADGTQGAKVGDTFKTDVATGQYLLPKLHPGNYMLVETEAPAGYELPANPITTFTVMKDLEDTIKVENTAKLVEVTIEKVDDNTRAKLEGAEFTLTGPDPDNTENRDIVVDADGNVNGAPLSLPPGYYTLTETKAPNGYDLPANPVTPFTVDVNEKNKLVTVENKAIPRDLIIEKIDSRTKNGLADAEFDLKNDKGDVIASIVTGADGKVTIPDLAPGTYSLVETKAPKGYNKIRQPIPVIIKNVNESNPDELIDLKSDGKYLMVLPVENKKTPPPTPPSDKFGKIELIKVDAADANVTLAGAKFEIEDEHGALVGELETDEDGYAVSEELPLGEYTLIEIEAPEGYELSTNPIEVKIDKANETVTATIENTKTPVGQIKLIKVDAEDAGKTLEGAEFYILDANNIAIGELKTDINGEAVSSDLPLGNYQLVEFGAPEGYELSMEIVKVTIDDVKTVEVTVENTKLAVDEEVGQIKLIKVDADDASKKLAGAKFNIVDKDGKVVDELTTNAKGEAVSSDLPVGDYTLVEVEAPKGYELVIEAIKVTVVKDEIVEKTVKNKKVSEGPGNPKPEEPGKPDPEEPGKPDPEEPGKPDPGPGEPIHPDVPESPGGGDSGVNPPDSGGDNNGNVNPPSVGNGGAAVNPPGSNNGGDKPGEPNKPTEPNKLGDTTNKLPQTGEEQFMYMIALGALFLAAGGIVLFRQRRRA